MKKDMKEKTKRLILLTIMVISLFGIVMTVKYAKDHLSNIDDKGFMEMGRIPSEISNEQNNMPFNNGNMSEPPEKPNRENNDLGMNYKENMGNHKTNKLTTPYIVIILGLSGLFSLILLYLIMSFKNKKFYKTRDKLIIYILGNIILIAVISIGTAQFTNNVLYRNNVTMLENEKSVKDEVILDKDNIIRDNKIDLNKEQSDVTITESGTYTFTGSFNHSIIVDANNDDVTIILDNVEIKNENTAAIIGLSANKITIKTENGTENTLSDGGNSEYDGCIFSNAELIFEGDGTLIVNGNQNEGEGIASEAQNITFNSGNYIVTANDDGINAGGDGATITFNDGTFYINANGDGIDSNKNAVINGGTIFVIGSDIGGDAGIDTDDGYTINGGTVVALGSDMIETPLNTSKQNVFAFILDNAIAKDTIVTLMKDDKEIISFIAPKSFKTIILSGELETGDYSLYKNGTHSGTLINGIYKDGIYNIGTKITINGEEVFNISKIINTYGKSIR